MYYIKQTIRFLFLGAGVLIILNAVGNLYVGDLSSEQIGYNVGSLILPGLIGGFLIFSAWKAKIPKPGNSKTEAEKSTPPEPAE